MAYEETDKLEIPITKLQWGLRGVQIFFALLAMILISVVIGWDNKFFSASLFSVFFLFIVLVSIFFAAAIVGIPHFYITKGKFKDAARALRIPRIEFVLSAIWAVLIFIFTALLSIDAFAIRKCDPSDPKYANFTSGSSNQTFYSGLPNICRTQRAANAFGWFALTAWLCSLVLIAKDWQQTRRPPKPQEPITYSKPSNSSLSSTSLEEHGLPDTPAQHQMQQQQFQISPTTFPQQPPGPMPPSGFTIPEPQTQTQGQGQGQGQIPGQNPGISFPEPKHY